MIDWLIKKHSPLPLLAEALPSSSSRRASSIRAAWRASITRELRCWQENFFFLIFFSQKKTVEYFLQPHKKMCSLFFLLGFSIWLISKSRSFTFDEKTNNFSFEIYIMKPVLCRILFWFGNLEISFRVSKYQYNMNDISVSQKKNNSHFIISVTSKLFPLEHFVK